MQFIFTLLINDGIVHTVFMFLLFFFLQTARQVNMNNINIEEDFDFIFCFFLNILHIVLCSVDNFRWKITLEVRKQVPQLRWCGTITFVISRNLNSSFLKRILRYHRDKVLLKSIDLKSKVFKYPRDYAVECTPHNL